MPKTRCRLPVETMSRLYLNAWTLEEIGELAGVTRERVRQLLPEEVKRKGKEQGVKARHERREQRRQEVLELVDAGFTRAEMQQRGFAYNYLMSLHERDEEFYERWKAASALRRERLTESNGPCRVCGGLVADRTNAVTCGGFCHRVYAHTCLRYHIDEQFRREHTVRIAQWHLANPGYGIASHETYARMVREKGAKALDKDTYFIEGSTTMKYAAECVRRGYKPVIDALSEREIRQVENYLDRKSDRKE